MAIRTCDQKIFCSDWTILEYEIKVQKSYRYSNVL